ncbi:hypothetical protein GCM10010411_72650 [Actinomadura fulvescens]|uniref:Uncharacterized protein n=1 Tax=Actinomadura fulvescens TaxID=46160 RepID=A0ABP6CVF1_9ACTN
MSEDVGAAAVLLDEAEALFRVEPLDGAGGHGDLLLVGSRPCTVQDRAPRWPIRKIQNNKKAPEAGTVRRAQNVYGNRN